MTDQTVATSPILKLSRALMLAITLTASFQLSALTGEASTNKEDSNNHISMEEIQRFSNAIALIKKYYVRPVDEKSLFNNAIRGMVGSLDPHSSYLDEDDFQELQTSTSGEFGGLGLEVTMEQGVIKVISPLADTPADKSGVKAGDYIIKLGNTAVQGLSLKDAVDLMRGKEGSKIELTILRKNLNKPLVLTLIREKIIVKSIKSKLLDDKFAYIRITQFQALTGEDMLAAITELKKKAGGEIKGLILDLRNNPGGLLDSAIEVSDAFLDDKKSGQHETIVYTQGRFPGSKFTAYANGKDVIGNAPMLVLINNGSASASEIVAGALKDNKRALILGTQSFGKGSVQTVLPLDEKRAIKLTTALYYTPSGISIQAKGISPDIVLEEIDVGKEANKKDLSDYSEADLSGHLLNSNKEKSKDASTKDDMTLLHEDYQLFAALTILKGLAISGK